ncbi:MAG TPA: hypothetical protein VFP53_02995, partial [Sphingomicrobium sp.]|nr:hypothetical protein [Sphingomicrobium sp.]
EIWPLHEKPRHFDMGRVLDVDVGDLTDFAIHNVLGRKWAGWWECDLSDNALTWTTGVYGIFGFPEGASVGRGEAVSLYCEDSRAVMERLRAYSIGHRSGFIVDARIRPASGEPERWMRLIGAPIFEDGSAIRLHGLKLIV